MSVLLQRAAAAARTPDSLTIDAIRIDGGTQARLHLNLAIVSEYAEAMAGGALFPPVVVYFDGETYWLADGFHRLAAHKQAKPNDKIFVEIRQGTRRDAIFCAVGANLRHGLRPSPEDKRNAVLTLLRDDEWRKMGNREIGRMVMVGHPLVAKLRAELSSLESIPVSNERTYITKHGTVAMMKTENIAASNRQRAAADAVEFSVQGTGPGTPTARCSRCGRELTDPDSVQAGIGPCCARRGKRHEGHEGHEDEDEIDPLARSRTPSGRAANARPQHIRNLGEALAEAIAGLEQVRPDADALGINSLGVAIGLLERCQDAVESMAD